MAKQARAFQVNPDDEEIAAPVKAKADATPAPAAAEPVPKGKWVRPEYRKGRRNLSIWLDEPTFNGFKAMVALKGMTAQEYVEAMIGREFEKNGWPNPTK